MPPSTASSAPVVEAARRLAQVRDRLRDLAGADQPADRLAGAQRGTGGRGIVRGSFFVFPPSP